MSFSKLNAEGYVSLIGASFLFVGIVVLFFYFVSGCSPGTLPEPIETAITEAAEDVIEGALGLEEGTIEIDLTPKDKESEE